jgi:hypothetical protein
MIGRDLSGSANFQRIQNALQHEEGSFFARANSDGVERLYTFRRIPDSPLIVFVGYAQEAIFKNWRKTCMRSSFRCSSSLCSRPICSRTCARNCAAAWPLKSAWKNWH